MQHIRLSAGDIHYVDTGGAGPVMVLVHGLIMDGTVWRKVMDELGSSCRVIVPTLPLGSHVEPMRPDADLSLRGMARLLAEFLERLNLTDVTLVANDWGGPIVTAVDHPERISRLVLVSCEAFDNIPPGLPGRAATLNMRIPGGAWTAFQLLRLKWARRLPTTFGWMSKRAVPDEVFDGWLRPAQSNAGVRRDLCKYVCADDLGYLEECTVRLAQIDKPILIVWAEEDRVMPLEHAHRLAKQCPRSRLVMIPDSYTLIPEDQPASLSKELLAFVREDAEKNTATAAVREGSYGAARSQVAK